MGKITMSTFLWMVLVLVYCGTSVYCAEIKDEPAITEDSLASGLKMAYRSYQQCADQQETLSCLKLRALRAVERALRSDAIPLVDGVSLVRSADGARTLADAPAVDEGDLPPDPTLRQDRLDELLVDRVGRFLGSHSLQFDMPRFVAESRQPIDALLTEGRGKGGLKKYGGALLMGLMMKGGLMAMAFKGVALLAGKALMVAKIALVLSAVVGLSKLLGGGGGDEKTTYEIVKHPHISHAYTHSSSHVGGGDYGGHGGGGGGGGHYETSGGGGGGGHGHGWGRSLDMKDAGLYPQLLAYSGQIQNEQEQVVNQTSTTPPKQL